MSATRISSTGIEPGTTPPRAVRWLFAGAGGLSFFLGAIGVAVPGWPTTVFWLVSAWCFSRSCPVLQRWIYNRPVVGPVIADLLEHRRISVANKRRAMAGVWLGLGVSGTLLITLGAPPAVGLIFVAIASGVSAWLHYGFRSTV